MRTRDKMLLIALLLIVLLVSSLVFLDVKLAPVEIKAEILPGLAPLTNALLTAVLLSLLLIVASFLIGRNLKEVPSGFQNVLEMAIDWIHNLCVSVAGEKWGPRFFPLIATIFLYVLVSNWFGLVPGLAAFGFRVKESELHAHEASAEHATVEAEHEVSAEETGEMGNADEEVIIPLFRSPSTDLNNNFALALISMITVQVVGVIALGPGYFTKFLNFNGFVRLFRGKREGSLFLGIFMACVDLFVGLLETISEFAKIISFSFRLFGNIFAGEVMLLVLTSLIPLVLTLPFLGLEVFVGLIQAFIFAVLTLAFLKVATISHSHDEEHH